MESEEIKYTPDHLWVKPMEAGLFRIGVTYDYLDRLAAIRMVELPDAGSKITKGESVAVLESSKAAIEIPAPFTGKIKKVNTDVISDPGLVNRQPMEDGWLVEIELEDSASPDGLLSEEEYRKSL
ncbi:MAG: glycine cleavage system protein H [Dehalococcoidales bacterium]|jgi:glycine cleavage system H protein|nr:glycine cleavage system protein H [Dehalococcoidales bacterium]